MVLRLFRRTVQNALPVHVNTDTLSPQSPPMPRHPDKQTQGNIITCKNFFSWMGWIFCCFAIYAFFSTSSSSAPAAAPAILALQTTNTLLRSSNATPALPQPAAPPIDADALAARISRQVLSGIQTQMSLEMQFTTFSDQLTAAVDNIVKHRFDMWVDENRAQQEEAKATMEKADKTALTSSITTQLTTIMDDLLLRALAKQRVVSAQELDAYANSASAMGRKFFARPFHAHSPRLWKVGLNDATCKDMMQLVEHVEDAVILEIGAANAQDIITLAGIAKRVYAYEPNPDKSNYIHLAVNAGGMSNAVLVRPVAASNETGTVRIDPMHAANDTSSSGMLAQAVRISDEIKERVHFASISAPGHELQVLDGMSDLVKTFDVDVIHITLHRSRVFPDSTRHWSDVAVWFHEAGYLCQVCRHVGGQVQDVHASLSHEELGQMAQFVQQVELVCF